MHKEHPGWGQLWTLYIFFSLITTGMLSCSLAHSNIRSRNIIFVNWKFMHNSSSRLMLESFFTTQWMAIDIWLLQPPPLSLHLLTTGCGRISGKKVPGIGVLDYFIRPHMPPVIVNNDCIYFGVLFTFFLYALQTNF